MAGDGWKELSTIYPKTCCVCGGRVSLKRGAFFQAKVKNGKIVKAESTCHLCLAERDDSRTRCIYCGKRTNGTRSVCGHHSDLLEIETL